VKAVHQPKNIFASRLFVYFRFAVGRQSHKSKTLSENKHNIQTPLRRFPLLKASTRPSRSSPARLISKLKPILSLEDQRATVNMSRKMPKKTVSAVNNNSNIVMETSGASDDSSDVDIYLEEPEEMVDILPHPHSGLLRHRCAVKHPKAPLPVLRFCQHRKDWNDAHADRDKKYDLTPLGEQNTNLAQTSVRATFVLIRSRSHLREIARAERERLLTTRKVGEYGSSL
jgi:hypothetical protein